MRIELFGSEYLNIIELNTTGDNENYIKGDSESKYVESQVFNLFAKCFENANKLYEFFGATKYNSRNIIPLRNEIIRKKEEFEAITSLEMFEEHLSTIFLGADFEEEIIKHDPNWKNDWKEYLNQLIELSKGLIEITEKCIENELILWVIGY